MISTHVFSFTTSDLIDLISSVILFLTLIVTSIYYAKSAKATKNTEKLQTAQKTIELKRQFISELLPAFNFIEDILERMQNPARPNMQTHYLLEFTRSEIDKKFGEGSMVTIQDAFYRIDRETYIKQLQFYLPRRFEFSIFKMLSSEKMPFAPDINNISLNDFYQNFEEIVNDTLYTLEQFSMHFVMKLANEALIFQSTHVRLIRFVLSVYPFIAFNNYVKHGYMYEHLVKLFQIWSKRQFKNIEQGQRDGLKQAMKNK